MFQNHSKSLTVGLVAGSVAALALAGCSSNSGSSSSSASPSPSGQVTITLSPQNNSGINGTATITPMGTNQIQVAINVTGEPDGAYEPAHIHMGTCANLNPTPQFFLTDSSSSTNGGQLWLQNGKATVTVNTTMSEIQNTAHAINIHLSPANLPHYVACGDIPSTGGSGSSTPTSSSSATSS